MWRMVGQKIGQFFIANPTLFLTLLYALTTGVGILSSWTLYREFGINIFDYAEIGDFVLAAFKSPNALFNFMSTVISLLIVMPAFFALSPWIVRLIVRLWVRSSEGSERRDVAGSSFERRLYESMLSWLSLFLPIVPLVLTVFLWVLSTNGAAQAEARAIKDGEKPLVVVQYRSFSSSAGQVTKPGLELIGATQRFVIFYDVNGKRTLVIPQAQLVAK
jgi:hypothetical protein